MKKIESFIITAILTFAVAKGQFTKIGGGLTYGTGFHFNNETAGVLADLNKGPFIGLFVTGTYKLNLPVRIAPSFTYFITRTNKVSQVGGEESRRVSLMMFDLNGHWIFQSLDWVEFYVLGGLDISFARRKVIGSSSSENDNAIGLNMGAGTSLKLTEKLNFFAEAKYILSKYDQIMLNAGVILNVKWLNKNEKP